MDALLITAGLILGFILRLGIPIGITLLLSWGLKRLDAKWRAESLAEAQLNTKVLDQPSEAYLAGPCWTIVNCAPAKRESCPVYQDPDMPCWEYRRTNGNYAKKCTTCTVWQQAIGLIKLDTVKEFRNHA